MALHMSSVSAPPADRAHDDSPVIDDDGQKMAKAAMAMAVYGIDQLDQDPREAWKPLQFRPAQHLRQPTGRCGGVPRSSSAPLCLAASPLRARRD